MSKIWNVSLSVVGVAIVPVVADTEAEAIEKAHENVALKDIEEFETLNGPCPGNICYRLHTGGPVATLEQEGGNP